MRAVEVLSLARKQIGTKERPVNRVRYNDVYYGREVDGAAYPWCCVFVWWVFHSLNRSDALFPKTAYCPSALAWFQARQRIVRDPLPGDIVFYNFNGGREPSHIGIVESVGPSSIVAIEGNTSDGDPTNGGMVMERVRPRRVCIAFARPSYAASEPLVDVSGYKTLRKGDTGAWVELLQNALTLRGFPVQTDGDFGPETDLAVRAFQRRSGIEVDGIVGIQTWGALFS